ncbi:hypothetical protein [Oligoflexus tunisiensis]|uniref:hypothetical protein n=1 Tax=Oligoflexus tunisiensis TaxID=708132 RepID=UPI00159F23B6|nr:hypothetical protein [Oligoflexus tunisiensis]
MKQRLTSSILFNLMVTAVPAWAAGEELFPKSLAQWQTGTLKRAALRSRDPERLFPS